MQFAGVIFSGMNKDEFTKRTGELQALVDRAVEKTLADFADKRLTAKQLAITVVDLQRADQPVSAGYRQVEPTYPASIVKMFYLAAAHRWMEDGRLADTAELRRAMKDMIVDSGNEATAYVLDVLSGTTSGPELSPVEMAQWIERREAVNRYFAAQRYAGINVSKKTWGEGPYGRDQQVLEEYKSPRNFLTTEATARLLAEIATGKCVTAKRSGEMMALLKRDQTRTDNADRQATEFIGPALPAGAKLWSKGGWMSAVRHDAAYVELPNGAKFVLVIFTAGHSENKDLIAAVARPIVEGFGTGRF